MKESFWALLIFFVLTVLLYYMFRPVNGWFWLIREGLKNRKTVIEDILKEMYLNSFPAFSGDAGPV